MTQPKEATIERVPAWVDKARLCFETCLGDTTVDDWIKRGLLPAPVKFHSDQPHGRRLRMQEDGYGE